MTRILRGDLLLTTCLLIVGCGGGSNPAIPPASPGLYRGTADGAGFGLIPDGQWPTRAEVDSDGNATVFVLATGRWLTLSGNAREASLMGSGVIAQGQLTTQSRSDGSQFIFQIKGRPIVQGVLQPDALPSLESPVRRPAAGDYVGDLTVISNGTMVEVGMVQARVMPDGSAQAFLSGTGGFIGSSWLLVGGFAEDGTATETSLFAGGFIPQTSPVRYSYTAEQQLTIQFSNLALEPGACIVVLRPGAVTLPDFVASPINGNP